MDCILPQNGKRFAAKWKAFCRKMENKRYDFLCKSVDFQIFLVLLQQVMPKVPPLELCSSMHCDAEHGQVVVGLGAVTVFLYFGGDGFNDIAWSVKLAVMKDG